MRCRGVTYVHTYGDEDGQIHSIAECDAGPGGDCGWEQPFDFEFGITSDEMDELTVSHRIHSDEQDGLPLHRTEAGWPNCSTCDGGGCLDCTDPA